MRGQIDALEAQGLKGQDEVQERIAAKRRIREHIAAVEALIYPPDEDDSSE